jgi:hypothetical protein
MKKTILILMSVFVIGVTSSYNYSENEAMEILKVNCPDAYDVVSTMRAIPESYGTSFSRRDGITHWLSTETPVNYIASFSTGVHECYHGYNSTAGKYYLDKDGKKPLGLDEYFCYYIKKGEKYIVKRTDVFPSAEMLKQFSLSTKMERFSTYIYPSAENQSTQQDGVYALLDEWNAYYLGMKTLNELIPYAKKSMEPTADNWKEYFFNINSDFIAYIEFKLYIANYLVYAKISHPDMYDKIIANKDFIKAYNAVDKAYGAQVDKYLTDKKSLIDYLNSNGLNVSEDETSINFGQDGIGNYVYKYKRVILELQKEKYASVFADLKE